MTVSPWQDAKEQVRQATDIVDLVGSYLSLRRQGRNFVAHCPWHDDSRPSLQVNQQRQSFKCWVCDIGGDVFSFAMKMEGVEFREALEMLAERAGIALAPERGSANRNHPFQRQNLLRVLAWAEEQFHQCLLQSDSAQPARDYLQTRGIQPASVERFHIGFSPDSWDWLLQRATAAGHPHEVLERVGLAIRREQRGGFYDRFRGRLLFPIRDVRSRPIAFGGRHLPPAQQLPSDTQKASEAHFGAKYINSPETPLFSKSTQLYALDLAREGIAREGELLVMEGYTDVIMAHQHGIENAVAVLGTALGEQHIPLVRRYTDRITLVLDGDEAGQRRSMQILDELLALFVEQEIDLKFLALPNGGDPCDVIGTQGSEAFRRYLTQSVDAIEYKIRAVTNGLALANDTHRSAQAVEEILGTLSRVRLHSGSVASPSLMREQQVLVRLAREFGLAEDQLRVRLAGLRRDRQRTHQSSPKSFNIPPTRNAEPQTSGSPCAESRAHALQQSALTVWEQELVELLLSDPNRIIRLVESVEVSDMQTEPGRHFYGLAVKIHLSGDLPTFDRMMLEVDEPDLKSLLVHCDEQAQAKAHSDADLRYRDLTIELERRKQKAQQQHSRAQLQQSQLQPEQEMELLAQLFADRQKAQKLGQQNIEPMPRHENPHLEEPDPNI